MACHTSHVNQTFSNSSPSSKCVLHVNYKYEREKIYFELQRKSIDSRKIIIRRDISLKRVTKSRSWTFIEKATKTESNMNQTNESGYKFSDFQPSLLSRSFFHNKHENPVRDDQPPLNSNIYKENYGVSGFKFPEVTTFRTNHANFCELSFDGTKTNKPRHQQQQQQHHHHHHHHHHRRNNSIKRVVSATTINCTNAETIEKQKEFDRKVSQTLENKVISKCRDIVTFHKLAEQFKKKLKGIESPVKLQTSNVKQKEKASAFKIILSPKTQPSPYSSIENMNNTYDSSNPLRHKTCIVTSLHHTPVKPNMQDREIQTTIIGIRNTNSYNPTSLQSVNDLFSDGMDQDNDQFNVKRRKCRKFNLTMINLPYLEIKCSSLLFEVPVIGGSERPQMPRRTLTDINVSIKESEVDTSIEQKISEPVADVDSNLKDKIFNLFDNTLVAENEDYNKKVNDLCNLIGSLLTDNKNNTTNTKTVKLPTEMLIDITKLSNTTGANRRGLLMPSLIHPSNNLSSCSQSPDLNLYSSNSSPNRSNTSSPQNRSRTSSPASRPSTPTHKNESRKSFVVISRRKSPFFESAFTPQNQSGQTSFESSPRCPSPERSSFPARQNISDSMKNTKYCFASTSTLLAAKSTKSKLNADNSKEIETEDAKSNVSHIPRHKTTLPRNVFLIPPHVNQILKTTEYKTTLNLKKDLQNRCCNNRNFIKPDVNYNLADMLKKKIVKQPWTVPNNMFKAQAKHEPFNMFIYLNNAKSKKDLADSSVTFNPTVDVYGKDDYKEEIRICSTPNPKCFENTIVPVTALKKSKTYPNKPELYADVSNNRNESNIFTTSHYQNSGLYTVRNVIRQPKQNSSEKPLKSLQGSFIHSSFLPKKPDVNTASCLQKRTEYANKLKIQKVQNKTETQLIGQSAKVCEKLNESLINKTPREFKSKLPIKMSTNETKSLSATRSNVNVQQIKKKTKIPNITKQTFVKPLLLDLNNTPLNKLKTETVSNQKKTQLNRQKTTKTVEKDCLNVVTKDVSGSTNNEKEIIFLKRPLSYLPKAREKFDVDPNYCSKIHEYIDRNSFNLLRQIREYENLNKSSDRQCNIDQDDFKCSSFKIKNSIDCVKINNSGSAGSAGMANSLFLSIPSHTASLEMIRSQFESMKTKEQNTKSNNDHQSKGFFPHENIVYVYRTKIKPFANVVKKDSLSRRKKFIKQLRKNEKIRTYSKIYENKLNANVYTPNIPKMIKDEKFENSFTQIQSKPNVVTFAEPSMCYFSATRYNNVHQPKKTNSKPKVLKGNQTSEYSTTLLKSCCAMLCSVCCTCDVLKNASNNEIPSEYSKSNEKKKSSNTICKCKKKKKRSKFKRKIRTLFKSNSHKKCNMCMISSVKSILENQKKPWNINNVFSNKKYFIYAVSNIPNNLYNFIKTPSKDGSVKKSFSSTHKSKTPNDLNNTKSCQVPVNKLPTTRLRDDKFPTSPNKGVPLNRIEDSRPIIVHTSQNNMNEKISKHNKTNSIRRQNDLYNNRNSYKMEILNKEFPMPNQIGGTTAPRKIGSDVKRPISRLPTSTNKISSSKSRCFTPTKKVKINELLTPKENIEDLRPIYNNYNTKLVTSKANIGIMKRNNVKLISSKIIIEEVNLLKKRSTIAKFGAIPQKQVAKLVMQTNEIINIPDPDQDLIVLKNNYSNESKSTVYKSCFNDGHSSNSNSSISSKKMPARNLFSIVGSFFRRNSRKVKKKFS